MGTVNVSYGNPMADSALMKLDFPFQTYHSVVQQIQNTSFTAAWSLPSGCFVNGVILAYTAITPFVAGASVIMPARASLATVPLVLPAGQANYTYALDVKET